MSDITRLEAILDRIQKRKALLAAARSQVKELEQQDAEDLAALKKEIEAP